MLFIILIPQAKANLYLQYSLYYYTDTSSEDSLEYSSTRNMIFLGATFLKGYGVLGWNTLIWNKAELNTTGGQETELSMQEMGPRFIFFLGDNKRFYFSLNMNFYAEGTRTDSSGDEKEISGTSTDFAIGYQIRMSKTFYGGFSIHYHTLSLAKETDDQDQTTDVTDKLSYTVPMLEFSLRF
jgi:hypothetical protein